MSKILPPDWDDFYGHTSDLIIPTIKTEAPLSYQRWTVFMDHIRSVVKTNISSISRSAPTNMAWKVSRFSVWSPITLTSSPSLPLLIFTERWLLYLPPSLHDTHSYICISYPCAHTLWHSHISNTLSSSKTPLSLSDTTNDLNTKHTHAHMRTHTIYCVCSWSMVFQWSVSLGWCWSGWYLCLRTSNWVNAGNRRRRRRRS